MATFKKFNKDKRPKRNTQSLLFKRKRFCRFTVAGVEEIDYKDVDTLRDFIAENGKIVPDRHARHLSASAEHSHQARSLPGYAALLDQHKI
jgi:small subunit ribosomal protein S18